MRFYLYIFLVVIFAVSCAFYKTTYVVKSYAWIVDRNGKVECTGEAIFLNKIINALSREGASYSNKVWSKVIDGEQLNEEALNEIKLQFEKNEGKIKFIKINNEVSWNGNRPESLFGLIVFNYNSEDVEKNYSSVRLSSKFNSFTD